jgi:phosphoribosylanthranilate isomerase
MGVEAIGVVAVPGSPRFLPNNHRAPVFSAAKASNPSVLRVLVVADPGELDLPALQVGNGHQVVQLHGHETVERCQRLRERIDPEIRLWKALRIRAKEDLEQCQIYAGVVDALLLDAWMPGMLGGTGRSIPLEWLSDWSSALPWWLAGGITPENVSDVLKGAQPDGVDVSSGVEDRPGWKNLERVERLLTEAQINRPPNRD